MPWFKPSPGAQNFCGGSWKCPLPKPGRSALWEWIWPIIPPPASHPVSCASFQALPYVALLIVMLFFIYAVIGMQVGQRACCSPASPFSFHLPAPCSRTPPSCS